MFLSDEEIERRLGSGDNLSNNVTVHKIKHGRGNVLETPDEIKKVVAILTEEGDSTQAEIGKAFNLTTGGVGHIHTGRNSREITQDVKDLTRERINKDRITAESKAIDLVLGSLNLVPDELSKGRVKKAKSLTSIARDVAHIANLVGNKSDDGGKISAHLHLYAPRQKSLEEYEVIDI